MIAMGTITISIDDDIERELRKLAGEDRGSRKGALGRAVGEAVKKWAEEKKQKEIAERQMKRMKSGMYKLPKNWKFDRDKIYARK